MNLRKTKMQHETLVKMVYLMGELRAAGCELDDYDDDMTAVRVAVHKARINLDDKIIKAEIA